MATTYLRPLTFDEVLDGAFSLYRRNFRAFFITALVPLLPMAALWAVAAIVLPSGAAGASAGGMLRTVGTIYGAFANILVYAALTREAANACEGESVSWQAGLKTGLRRYPSVLVGAFLAALAMTVGMLFFIVPGVLIGIMFFAVVPVTVLEGKGPFAALARSKRLAKGAWGRIFGVMFVLYLIVMIPAIATAGAGGAAMGFSAMAGTSAWGTGMYLLQIANVLLSALTAPLLMAGVVLLYFDRRVRSEGLDLEREVEQLAPSV